MLLVVSLVAGEEGEGGKCERIRLPLCQDLGYNWTAMPNLVGHGDQKEAEDAVRTLLLLLLNFVEFATTNKSLKLSASIKLYMLISQKQD